MSSTFVTAFCITVPIVAIIFAVAIALDRRYTKKVKAIEQTLSERTKNVMMNQPYRKEKGRNMFSSLAYIISAEEANNHVTAVIFYYSGPIFGFQYKRVRISKDRAEAWHVAEGAFVPALFKYSRENRERFYLKKIMDNVN